MPLSLKSRLAKLSFLALHCAPLGVAHAHPVPSGYRAQIAWLMKSPVGAPLAKRLLGDTVARFNPGGVNEVLEALDHPANLELARAVSQRLEGIYCEARRLEAKLSGMTPAERNAHIAEVAARMAEARFALNPAVRDRIEFIEGSQNLGVHTSSQARRAEFLMGGRLAPLRGARAASAAELAPPPKGYRRDAFEQFLAWEERANDAIHQATTQFFGLEMAEAEASGVTLRFGAQAPEELRRLFSRGRKVMWPKHPFNTDKTQVPFTDLPAVERWPTRFTASRSMVVWDRPSGRAFSIKAPTDHPHPRNRQPRKALLHDDIVSALLRSDHITRMDAKLGPDDGLIILKEAMTAEEHSTRNGFIVRDLSPLMDGNYYLPAFAIKHAGEAIAKLNGAAASVVWESAFAEALGRAKARLLIRYGVMLEYPHPQNVLIQLDRQLRPTGRIVFRDVSDSFTVRPILEAIGEHAALDADVAIEYAPLERLSLMTENSLYGLDNLPAEVLASWSSSHDRSFSDEVLKLAGWQPTAAMPEPPETSGGLENWLFSPEGLKGVRAYHERGAARERNVK